MTTFLLPFVLLIVATVLWLWLAERDHQRRRQYMGLPEEPSAWSQYLTECYRRRARCEARLGVVSERSLRR